MIGKSDVAGGYYVSESSDRHVVLHDDDSADRVAYIRLDPTDRDVPGMVPRWLYISTSDEGTPKMEVQEIVVTEQQLVWHIKHRFPGWKVISTGGLENHGLKVCKSEKLSFGWLDADSGTDISYFIRESAEGILAYGAIRKLHEEGYRLNCMNLANWKDISIPVIGMRFWEWLGGDTRWFIPQVYAIINVVEFSITEAVEIINQYWKGDCTLQEIAEDNEEAAFLQILSVFNHSICAWNILDPEDYGVSWNVHAGTKTLREPYDAILEITDIARRKIEKEHC